VNLVTFVSGPIELFIVALRGMAQMEEELAACLRQLTEALAPNKARRLSIVRDGDKPPGACADGHGRDQDVVTAPKPAAVV